MSTLHSKRAAEYQKNPDTVTHHDQTFYNVRAKRDRMAQALPEWEELRDMADRIKRHTISHLDTYLEKFEAAATANGVHVHWAEDVDEYNDIVYSILQQHGVKKVVKSKSMLTEECHLNRSLEEKGIEVIETDLGERILQMMKLAPSHIVMPALHVHKEDIRDCFKAQIAEYDEFRRRFYETQNKPIPEDENDADPTMLTFVARLHLRNQFMTADAGMTGCNFGIAETGDVVVCTNEGNADMSTSIPKLHIVSMGIEKLIPDYKAMGVFQRLLARCGTGQETTVYTSHFRGPKPGGEMHIVLVDNWRSRNIGNREHWQTLKCMRCGACMNTCPVYRRSAGYSYSYFIPGPIGINLGMLNDRLAHSGNVSACSLCMSCDNVCPVKVDLSHQIYLWRQQLDDFNCANPMKKAMSNGMATLFNHPQLYVNTLRLAPLANHVPHSLMHNCLNPWANGHEMMKFPKKSFHTLWKTIKEEK